MKKNLFTNLIDYNTELEKILDNKDFSKEVKNLLLNLLYKIETSYTDYKKTKVIVQEKREYCQEIIKNINNYCNRIEIIKPKSSKEIDNKEPVINKEEGIIKTYQNEKQLLKAIIEIAQNEIKIDNKYYIAQKPLMKFLKKTYIDNKIEVIRDFNGWNWYRNINEIENPILNIIFQNLLILVGYQQMQKVIENDNIDYDSIYNIKLELEKEYNREIAENVIDLFLIIISQNYYKNDLETLTKEYEEIKEQKEKICDREEYIKDLSKKKKQKMRKIQKIEEICIDKSLLENEFIKRNKKEQLIFSLKTLIQILKREKQELIEEINKISQKMNPKKFEQMEKEIDEKIKLLESIKNTKIENNIDNLQKQFIEALGIKLEKCKTKKELLDLAYIVRYYNLLEYNERKCIYQVKKINVELESFINKLIVKLFEEKICKYICDDLKTNLKIYNEIFRLKVIDLENLEATIEKNDSNYLLTINDDESIEYVMDLDKFQVQGTKLNKKIKIFY